MRNTLLTLTVVSTLAVASFVHAQTTPDPLTASSASLTDSQKTVIIAQLQEIIVQLTRQLQQLLAAKAGQLTSSTACTITSTLGQGSRGAEVTCLQHFLIQHGYLASGNDSGYFGPLTQAAVQAFQAHEGIVSSGTPISTGYGQAGSLTRQRIIDIWSKLTQSGGSTVTPPIELSPIGGPLDGGGGGGTPPIAVPTPPTDGGGGDTTPPTVSITAPAQNAQLANTATLTANASDNVAVASVQFQLDGVNLGAPITQAPYTYAWDTTTAQNGAHTITVIATDTAGNTASAAVTVTLNAWIPSWLPAANLPSASAWSSFSIDPAWGCNSVTFATDASIGNYFIGRRMDSGTCASSNWSLVLGHMDWTAKKMLYDMPLVDTTNGPVTLGDGSQVASAYDPSLMYWNGETWVAFECALYPPQGATLRACVGPLKADHTLDLSRTAVVVRAVKTGTDIYSTSVPQLLAYKGHIYLYWTVVKIDASVQPIKFVQLTGRAVELAQEPSGLRRLFVKGHLGSVIDTEDPSSVEVFGLDPSDPRSNTTADLGYQVMTDGTYIYHVGARGGSGCVTPLETSPGCYRTTISRTTDPLGYHTFNTGLIPDKYLPPNPASYPRFVLRTTDNATVLIVGNFHNPANLSGVPVGTFKYFVWPDHLVVPVSVPPSVTLTSPAEGASVSGSVSVSATASANAGVVSVQFQIDGVNLGSAVTQAPYSSSWDTTTAPNGSHTITAIVTDTAGKTAQSSASFTVNNVVFVNHTPTGAFDWVGVTSTGKPYVSAWAFDPDASSTALTMTITKDGVQLYSGPTNLASDGLNASYGITGMHRINYIIPSSVAGTYRIYATDANTGAQVEESSSPRTITAGTSCTLDGLTVPNDLKGYFYSARTSTNCGAVQQARTCTNGVFNGGSQYQYASCSTATASSGSTLSQLASVLTALQSIIQSLMK